MADSLYIKLVASDLPEGALKVKIKAVEVVGEYVECGNADSLESLLKRCIVYDGTDLVLQVNYVT